MQRFAHTLKGAAGGLGATELQMAATALEEAVRGRDPVTMESARNEVLAVLARVIAGLQQLKPL
ncbi:MAG: Hpt domain-containing protein [Zoogloeaceae bacterium]|nr:Hpt domain-containing protein [Zoogloeaceae bacterium]